MNEEDAVEITNERPRKAAQSSIPTTEAASQKIKQKAKSKTTQLEIERKKTEPQLQKQSINKTP